MDDPRRHVRPAGPKELSLRHMIHAHAGRTQLPSLSPEKTAEVMEMRRNIRNPMRQQRANEAQMHRQSVERMHQFTNQGLDRATKDKTINRLEETLKEHPRDSWAQRELDYFRLPQRRYHHPDPEGEEEDPNPGWG